ncbi:hypothetical protein PoB_006179000 [Plakobranchus ocellatus]|uniref:Secreted protein n=1 Tax=Plakobranchus ocellatus TaxID=259542 RepID=A0AAV4CU12_9GAST|nr:hypothetical protein PoB_006179000 [Plakobranchus ocellatus]
MLFCRGVPVAAGGAGGVTSSGCSVDVAWALRGMVWWTSEHLPDMRVNSSSRVGPQTTDYRQACPRQPPSKLLHAPPSFSIFSLLVHTSTLSSH